jgi:hypothetical protein
MGRSQPSDLKIVARSRNTIKALMKGIKMRCDALSFDREYETNVLTGPMKITVVARIQAK